LREPPFDDELDPTERGGRPGERTLPFSVSRTRTHPPAQPTAAAHPWPAEPGSPDARRPHPDPETQARRLLIGVIEWAAGKRPMRQLGDHISAAVRTGLQDQFDRAASRGRPHWLHDATVGTVHSSEPVAGVAELAATLKVGRRLRAAALRLEFRHGRWRCTMLQLG
jgi:hypothetical protein